MRTEAIAVDGNSRPLRCPSGPHPVPAHGRVIDDIARVRDLVWGAFLQEADRTFDDEPEFLTIDVEMSDVWVRGGVCRTPFADGVKEHAVIPDEFAG